MIKINKNRSFMTIILAAMCLFGNVHAMQPMQQHYPKLDNTQIAMNKTYKYLKESFIPSIDRMNEKIETLNLPLDLTLHHKILSIWSTEVTTNKLLKNLELLLRQTDAITELKSLSNFLVHIEKFLELSKTEFGKKYANPIERISITNLNGFLRFLRGAFYFSEKTLLKSITEIQELLLKKSSMHPKYREAYQNFINTIKKAAFYMCFFVDYTVYQKLVTRRNKLIKLYEQKIRSKSLATQTALPTITRLTFLDEQEILRGIQQKIKLPPSLEQEILKKIQQKNTSRALKKLKKLFNNPQNMTQESLHKNLKQLDSLITSISKNYKVATTSLRNIRYLLELLPTYSNIDNMIDQFLQTDFQGLPGQQIKNIKEALKQNKTQIIQQIQKMRQATTQPIPARPAAPRRPRTRARRRTPMRPRQAPVAAQEEPRKVVEDLYGYLKYFNEGIENFRAQIQYQNLIHIFQDLDKSRIMAEAKKFVARIEQQPTLNQSKLQNLLKAFIGYIELFSQKKRITTQELDQIVASLQENRNKIIPEKGNLFNREFIQKMNKALNKLILLFDTAASKKPKVAPAVPIRPAPARPATRRRPMQRQQPTADISKQLLNRFITAVNDLTAAFKKTRIEKEDLKAVHEKLVQLSREYQQNTSLADIAAGRESVVKVREFLKNILEGTTSIKKIITNFNQEKITPEGGSKRLGAAIKALKEETSSRNFKQKKVGRLIAIRKKR